jgi:hypothetical protein
MCMDQKTAVKTYTFGERAKSELIICSQLSTALPAFPETERPGGKRMLILLMESVRSEIGFAFANTSIGEFRKAGDLLSEAISLAESDQFGAASLRISESISASTTAAQAAWLVLNEHGLI